MPEVGTTPSRPPHVGTTETHTPVEPLPWMSRISAMPYLPGGASHQLDALRTLCSEVRRTDGLLTATLDADTATPRTLKQETDRLGSTGLLDRIDRHHVAISPNTEQWLESSDPYYLAAALHRHVRYIGEMLLELCDGHLGTRDLALLGDQKYSLNWSTLDQVRRRLAWLDCLGFVEYKTTQTVGLTALGAEYCSLLIPEPPLTSTTSDALQQPVEVPPSPPGISEVLSALGAEKLSKRHAVLGYIPRGSTGSDVSQNLSTLVNACIPSISRADLIQFCSHTFDISSTSFGASLTTLTKAGLVEQIGMNVFAATAIAREWIESNSSVNLIRILHTKFLFFLEIIAALSEFDNAPELAKAATEYYGLARLDVGGVRTRLQLLRAAGLIEEKGTWRYQPTPLGVALASSVQVQIAKDSAPLSIEGTALQSDDVQSRASEIAVELVAAGTASETPLRLELALVAAFQYLGFDARHLGGSGKTDVLLIGHDEANRETRVIVDAKSARSGTVNEGSIQFDTLVEHKAAHHADMVGIVGPNFESGRIRERAKQNAVSLITTTELASVVQRQALTPRSVSEFFQLLSSRADGRKDFESSWAAHERRIALLGIVVGVLAQETQDADEVTHGALSSDQIYLIIRGELDPRPSPSEIQDVLELLRHPLVKAVLSPAGASARVSANQLVDRPSLVASKLRALARSLDGLEDGAGL